uniref:Uncharacterized protein n=1 Tax=Panagrolaimus davidi TaxID=227884 RepID=A0A914PQH4_9BILA
MTSLLPGYKTKHLDQALKLLTQKNNNANRVKIVEPMFTYELMHDRENINNCMLTAYPDVTGGIRIIITPIPLQSPTEPLKGHTVLGVFDIQNTVCYFLDSLMIHLPSSVPVFGQYKQKFERDYLPAGRTFEMTSTKINKQPATDTLCTVYAFTNCEAIFLHGKPKYLVPFEILKEDERLRDILANVANDSYNWSPTEQEKFKTKYQTFNPFQKAFYSLKYKTFFKHFFVCIYIL